jgi:TPR repeat protein
MGGMTNIRWMLVLVAWASVSQVLVSQADTAAGLAAYESGDYAQAMVLLGPEAEKGDAEAQVKYGLIFAKGLGTDRDPNRAIPWFEKSAAQGNAEAMYCMGIAYDIGDAGAKDMGKAAAWYRKAAEGGYAKAQYNLGQMLQSGDGIPADAAESAIWLRKAADQNVGDAEYALARAYLKGIGVQPNILSVRYWIERSELHGAADAKEFADKVHEEFSRVETENHLPHSSGGDGSNFETAIAFPDAKDGFTGIEDEHKFVAYYFNTWSWSEQALVNHENRAYDLITLQRGSEVQDIYFDVTDWFGMLK